MKVREEIQVSILNLFQSNISSKIISNYTDMSIDEIEDLRSNSLKIYEISLDKVFSLYNCAVKNKKNKSFLDKENSKGSCSQINLDIKVRKLYVSWYDYGLFTLGILEDRNRNCKLKNNEDIPERLFPAKNVFLNEYNEVVYKADERFICGYNGGSPKNFRDFISEYSKMKESEIEKIIFNNSIVSYDFYEDKLEGHENILLEYKNNMESEFLSLYKYNDKLIIKLLNDERKEFFYKANLDEYIEKIYIVLNILKDKYKKDIRLKQIKYIKNTVSDETKIYKSSKFLLDMNMIDLVLEFDEFEIWMKTGIYSDDIFRNKDMINFLEKLDLKVNIENNFIDKVLRKINRKLSEDGNIEILQIIQSEDNQNDR